MNNSIFSLEGKTILVTGASSGIGKAVAIECSKMGASVFLSARNRGRLEQTPHGDKILAKQSAERILNMAKSKNMCPGHGEIDYQ